MRRVRASRGRTDRIAQRGPSVATASTVRHVLNALIGPANRPVGLIARMHGLEENPVRHPERKRSPR
tara:strand:+ start:11 stop:211 length:201 start_codon:yes stop_codon:yes gene_type:complete